VTLIPTSSLLLQRSHSRCRDEYIDSKYEVFAVNDLVSTKIEVAAGFISINPLTELGSLHVARDNSRYSQLKSLHYATACIANRCGGASFSVSMKGRASRSVVELMDPYPVIEAQPRLRPMKDITSAYVPRSYPDI